MKSEQYGGKSIFGKLFGKASKSLPKKIPPKIQSVKKQASVVKRKATQKGKDLKQQAKSKIDKTGMTREKALELGLSQLPGAIEYVTSEEEEEKNPIYIIQQPPQYYQQPPDSNRRPPDRPMFVQQPQYYQQPPDSNRRPPRRPMYVQQPQYYQQPPDSNNRPPQRPMYVQQPQRPPQKKSMRKPPQPQPRQEKRIPNPPQNKSVQRTQPPRQEKAIPVIKETVSPAQIASVLEEIQNVIMQQPSTFRNMIIDQICKGKGSNLIAYQIIAYSKKKLGKKIGPNSLQTLCATLKELALQSQPQPSAPPMEKVVQKLPPIGQALPGVIAKLSESVSNLPPEEAYAKLQQVLQIL